MEDNCAEPPNSDVVAGAVSRRQGSLWRGSVPAAGTLAALLGLAACGGSSSGSWHAGGSANSRSTLAFSSCVRSHGVPNFPDPDSKGNLPNDAKQIAQTNPQFPSATRACQNLLPNGDGLQPSQALLLQAWSDSYTFTQYMRSHGVSNWPGPTSDPVHRPERATFDLQAVGIDQNSLQIAAKIRECEPLLHGWAPYVIDEAGQTTFLGGS